MALIYETTGVRDEACALSFAELRPRSLDAKLGLELAWRKTRGALELSQKMETAESGLVGQLGKRHAISEPITDVRLRQLNGTPVSSTSRGRHRHSVTPENPCEAQGERRLALKRIFARAEQLMQGQHLADGERVLGDSDPKRWQGVVAIWKVQDFSQTPGGHVDRLIGPEVISRPAFVNLSRVNQAQVARAGYLTLTALDQRLGPFGRHADQIVIMRMRREPLTLEPRRNLFDSEFGMNPKRKSFGRRG